MRSTPLVATFTFTLISGFGLLAAGCASDGATAAGDTAAGTSPAEVAWMDKHARFNAAIEGISFDGGIVNIISPLDGDLDQAEMLRREGLAHYNEARYIEAVAAHVRAVRMAPEFTAAYFNLGEAVLAHGKVDLAVAAYRTALAMDEGFTDARFNLANALWMMAESEAAVAEMDRVVQRDPARAAAHERLAIWSYYAGDDATAWQHVLAAEGLSHQVPPQFLALLEARSPRGDLPGR